MGEKIGFIGSGKMTQALIGGILGADLARREDMIASDPSSIQRDVVAREYGITVTKSNREVVSTAQTVFIAVHPQHYLEALAPCADAFDHNTLTVSIMAGVTARSLEEALPSGVPVVRVMPNIACLVKGAASAVARGTHATSAHQKRVIELLESVGVAVPIEERLMDAVTGLSGSGPAYAFAIIEGLADGGVAEGLPRDIAITLAAQTLLGASRMVLETGEHPALLRDRVTSPAGTTAEGLAALEARGIRSAMAEAVRQAARRSRSLGEGSK